MAQKYYRIRRAAILALGLSFMAIAPLGKLASVRAAEGKPLLQIQGVLETGDKVLTEDDTLYDIHTFEGRAGQSVVITVESSDFDTYLLIADSEGEILDENNDIGPENMNSRIAVTLPRDGIYNIVVNGYESKDRGRYSLTVK